MSTEQIDWERDLHGAERHICLFDCQVILEIIKAETKQLPADSPTVPGINAVVTHLDRSEIYSY